MFTTQLNYLASFAKWSSVRLRTKWLWVRVSLKSLKLPISHLFWARSSLTFRQTIECGFTLKLVRDMIITYSQMHRTDKYSQHSSIIWSVWLNGWVFVYELIVCRFESRCGHLNSRFCACFEQRLPWHSGNYRVWIHPETRTWHDKNVQFPVAFIFSDWISIKQICCWGRHVFKKFCLEFWVGNGSMSKNA